MRKHFLILMLLSLLPLAGWADEPSAKTPTYTGAAQDLITAGSEVGYYYFYAVVANGAAAPAKGAFAAAVPQGTNAGDYDVYYVKKNADVVPTDGEAAAATKIDVNIAKAGTVVLVAKNPSMVYGGASPTLADFYEITSKPGLFDTEGGVASLGAPVDMPDIDIVNAGSRNFTLVAKEYTNYDVSVPTPNGTLTIAKKAITVTAADHAAITYGTATPNDFTVLDYSLGLIGEDALTGTLAFDFKKGGVLVDASPLPAGVYEVYPKGLDNSNYAITFAPGAFTVNQKALAPSMITAMAATTYNKTNQAPTLTVTDNGLIVAADYNVSWTGPNGVIADPTAADAFVTAGDYTVTLTGNGKNYKTPAGTPGEPAATATYKINKKTLYVKTNNVEKTYDGITPYAPAANATHLTFVGLEAGDPVDFTGLAVALGDVDGLTTGVDAGIYPLNVSGALTNATLTKNYTPNYGSIGKLTIAKKAITILANNDQKNYGEADTYAAGKVATAVVAKGTKTAGTVQLFAGSLNAGESFTTLPTLTREDNETAGDYALVPSGGVIKNDKGTPADPSDDVDVTKNYEITYNNGTFSIVAGGFTIWADDKTSAFGADLKTLTATVSGIPAADADKIVFAADAITTDATASSNRGTYTISIDKSKIDFSAISALYDIAKVTIVPGNYVITPAPLKIKAKAQARQVGDVVLPASADNIEFVTEGVSAADQAEVIANITLAFSAAPADCVVPVDGGKALTVDAKTTGWTGTAAATADKDKGIWVNGIVIDPAAYNALPTANYTLNALVAAQAQAQAGTLYVTAAGDEITLNRVAKADFATPAKNNAVATIAANDGKMLTVKLGDPAAEPLEYLKEKWYSIVLPFDTDVKTVSEAFGYAVVDVFDKDNSNGTDVRFKLHMQELPANEPFLVKIYRQKPNNDVQFANVIIKNSAAPKIADAYGNEFVGTYAGKNGGLDGDYDYVFGMGANKNSYDPAGASFYVRPLGAWVHFKDAQSASAPHMIYIEEADGSTTSISVATREAIAKTAEGWYNLNGVKLNAAPTEKGIYIQNGKKVVIK